jgi:aspartate aminotransferase-like enzyme
MFRQLYEECVTGLEWLFHTSGEALAFAGTGSTSFESAQLSLARPGDSVLAISAGRFGERWREFFEQASWLDLDVSTVQHGWGETIDPDRVRDALKRKPETSIVTIVHVETSAASICDLESIARAVRETAPNALLVADVISSVGAAPMEMDAWGIDAAVTASQKTLGMPPGLGVVALGARALERLDNNESAVPRTMDLRWHLAAHRDGWPACTPPVAHFMGLRESLHMIREEGLVQRQERIARQASRVQDTFLAMGLELFAQSPSPSVTALKYPDGIGDSLIAECRANHDVWIIGGQDQYSGTMFRVGHMGSVSDMLLIRGLEAIVEELSRLSGGALSAEDGLRVAHRGLHDAMLQT